MQATFEAYGLTRRDTSRPVIPADRPHYGDQVIISYIIVLQGRHRLARVQFLYNRFKQQSVSGSGWRKGSDKTGSTCVLQETLRNKFGQDAVAILSEDGIAWHDETDMINAGMLRNRHRYFVLYDEAAPTYEGRSKDVLAVASAQALPLPGYYDLPVVAEASQPSVLEQAAQDVEDYTQPPQAPFVADRIGRHVHRIGGYSYYDNLPLFSKRIGLRLADGKVCYCVLTNKDTRHIDALLNYLSSVAGTERWVGVRVPTSTGETQGSDDELGMARPAVNYGPDSLAHRDTADSSVGTATEDTPGKLPRFGLRRSSKSAGKQRGDDQQPASDKVATSTASFKEYLDDTLLYDDDVVDGCIYDVTYRLPSKTDFIAKARDRNRDIVYTRIEGF
ncbi:hypothetical protein PYCC9005_000055 [Savitreella phatthalungensis]